MPLKVKVVLEREIQGSDIPRIFSDSQKLAGNRFLNLYFERLETDKLDTQDRMLAKGMEDNDTNFWRGKANGLIEAKDLFQRLLKEVQKQARGQSA